MKRGKKDLEKQLFELEEENIKSAEVIARLNNLIALQRAVMYANTKEKEKLQRKLNNGEYLYKRVYDGLKHFFTTEARLARIKEHQKKIYFKLIKYGANYDEISRIEREDGYNGLRKRFVEIIADRRTCLRGSREGRTVDEQTKINKRFREKYMKKTKQKEKST